MAKTSPTEALERAAKQLAVCGRHLANAQSLPGQQRELLNTAVIALRSIWHIFFNMDKSDPWVTAWFKELSVAVKSDSLLSFFRSERNMILKEGVDTIKGVCVRAKPGAMASAGPEGFTFRWSTTENGLQEILVPRPANAKSSFMGDQSGGMGYFIELPDGTQVKQYVHVPLECAQVTLFYPEAPLEHLGKQLETREAKVLLALYHAYWQRSCAELGHHLKKGLAAHEVNDA